MSLQTRLTALAQAVGADIKTLNSKLPYKGDWAAATTYNKGDIVWYSNDFWVAVRTTSGAGEYPTTDYPTVWRLLSEGMSLGGATGQVLAKASGNSFDTTWIDLPKASVPMDPWHIVGSAGEPAFGSGFATPGGLPGLMFRKDPLGRVWIYGVVNGTSGGTAFTLPVGYRPVTAVAYFDMLLANGAAGGYVQVTQSTGAVVVTGPGGQFFVDISFDTGLVSQMPTGPQGAKGDKGDIGGTMGAAGLILGTTSTPNGSSPRLPLGPVVTEDPVGFFTRNADNSISVKEAGWYSFSVGANSNVTVAANTPLGMGINKNDVEIYFPSIFEGYYYGRVHVSGIVYLVPGDRLDFRPWNAAVATITTWSMQGMQIARLGGPQGPKGDAGGNSTVALDPWHTVGGAGENSPYGTAWGPASVIGQIVSFRKDPFGRVKLRGVTRSTAAFTWGSILFTLPLGYRPLSMPQDYEAIMTEPDGSNNQVVQVRANLDGTVVLTSQVTAKTNGGLATGGSGSYIRLDGWEFDTDSVSQYMVGPQGAKGDPGSVSVVKTLNWNTATQPNFYRSTNDGLEQTLNGPGDQLNKPRTAGVVYLHENGALVQRVWDLDFQVGYTRYRGQDGVTWSSWVADLVKPRLDTDLLIGGAAPQDGEERYFQTPAMLTQGVIWKFRYHKVQNKWHFVGGSDYLFSAAGLSANAGASVTDAGLVFPVTLSGEYDVTWGARMYQNPSGASSGNVQLFAEQMRAGSSVAGAILDLWAGPIPGQTWSTVFNGEKSIRFTSMVNGDTLRLRSTSTTYNGAIETPYLRVRPVRVSM